MCSSFKLFSLFWKSFTVKNVVVHCLHCTCCNYSLLCLWFWTSVHLVCYVHSIAGLWHWEYVCCCPQCTFCILACWKCPELYCFSQSWYIDFALELSFINRITSFELYFWVWASSCVVIASLAASFASVSAISFPTMSLWSGT